VVVCVRPRGIREAAVSVSTELVDAYMQRVLLVTQQMSDNILRLALQVRQQHPACSFPYPSLSSSSNCVNSPYPPTHLSSHR
jgi:hypothetical protein